MKKGKPTTKKAGDLIRQYLVSEEAPKTSRSETRATLTSYVQRVLPERTLASGAKVFKLNGAHYFPYKPPKGDYGLITRDVSVIVERYERQYSNTLVTMLLNYDATIYGRTDFRLLLKVNNVTYPEILWPLTWECWGPHSAGYTYETYYSDGQFQNINGAELVYPSEILLPTCIP